MQEKTQKTYTMEDNVKSIYFQNKDILKALAELKSMLGMKEVDDKQSDRPNW